MDKALPARTNFMKALIKSFEVGGVTGRQTRVLAECSKQIAKNKLLNTWFDPIDPLGKIKTSVICQTQFNIINKVHDSATNGSISLSQCITTSYLTSIKVYTRQFEADDYDECTNTDA